MSDDGVQYLHDRNLVPADEIDHLNILRYAPRDPPTVAIFDPPTRCYQVNEEWAKHIMGAVTGLQAWKAWTGEEDELNAAVQSIMEFMVGEVCSMFLLRQSPTKHCLLEQSIDGGVIWTPAFDFSLCMAGGSDASIAIYIDIAITNINTLNVLYVDAGFDITVMYPNVEYDSGPQDADRNTALCYSLEALTEGIYNAAEAVINQQISRNNFLSQIVSGLTGGFWASDGSLIAALSQSVVDAIFGTDALQAASDALANTNARRAVVCCLYDNLFDNTATFALWQLAGIGCDFTPASDEQLLLDVLAPILAGLDAYLSWVTLLSNGVDLAIAEIIGNDCLDCVEWRALIDFSVDDGGFVRWDGGSTYDAGVWVDGVGWIGSYTAAGGYFHFIALLSLVLDSCRIGPIQMTYNLDLGFNFNQDNTALWLNRAPQNNEEVITSAVTEGNSVDHQTNSNYYSGVNNLIIGLRSAWWEELTPPPVGSLTILELDIYGQGTPPSQLVPYLI